MEGTTAGAAMCGVDRRKRVTMAWMREGQGSRGRHYWAQKVETSVWDQCGDGMRKGRDHFDLFSNLRVKNICLVHDLIMYNVLIPLAEYGWAMTVVSGLCHGPGGDRQISEGSRRELL